MKFKTNKVFAGQKESDLFIICRLCNAEAVNEVNALAPGEYVVEIKKSNPRGLRANAYFHKLCSEIAKAVGSGDDEIKIQMNLEYGTVACDEYGNPVTVELPNHVDMSLFYSYAKWIGYSEDGQKSIYLMYKATHTLTTAEMAKLIDGVQYEAKALGIETLDELNFKSLIKTYDRELKKQKERG